MNNFLKKTLISKIILASLCILGLCLIIIPSVFASKNKAKSDDVRYYTSMLEEQVEELILQMSEIERVSVLITLENSGETVYAKNQSSGSSEYVLFSSDDGESGLKLAEINPVVRGVAVVCNNGDDIRVKEKITSLLASALGISTNRITVTG